MKKKNLLLSLIAILIVGCSTKGNDSSLYTPSEEISTIPNEGNSSSSSQIPVEVTGIQLNKSETIIKTGKNEQLTATILPEGATGSINWTSSNEDVITVSNKGKISAVSVGKATITAKIGNFTATCLVNVEQAYLAALPSIAAITPSEIVKTGNEYFYLDGYKDEKTEVGDGVEYHKYTAPGVDGTTRTIHSVIVDLSLASIEAGSPSNTYYFNHAPATVYSQAYDFDTVSPRRAMAAINADFFGYNSSTGLAAICNIFVKDGIVVNSRSAFKDDSETSKLYSGMMVFGISYNDVPIIAEGASKSNVFYRIDNLIEIYTASGEVKLKSAAIEAINGNDVKDNHQAERTRANEAYTESGYIVSNKNVVILNKIQKHDNGIGSVNFPVDGVVTEVKENYSGTLVFDEETQLAITVSADLLTAAKVGRIVRVGRTDSDNDDLDNMKVILGGRHELVENGQIASTLASETTNSAKIKRARSAIGILKDGRVFIFAVNESNGMNLQYVADFMKYQGCVSAMNFDGGGSTRLYVDGGYNGSGTFGDARCYSSENRRVVNTLIVATK